jgi:hypothetical protein
MVKLEKGDQGGEKGIGEFDIRKKTANLTDSWEKRIFLVLLLIASNSKTQDEGEG